MTQGCHTSEKLIFSIYFIFMVAFLCVRDFGIFRNIAGPYCNTLAKNKFAQFCPLNGSVSVCCLNFAS